MNPWRSRTVRKIVAHENVLKGDEGAKDGQRDDRFRTEQGWWPSRNILGTKDASFQW